jgi:hypothetical protein
MSSNVASFGATEALEILAKGGIAMGSQLLLGVIVSFINFGIHALMTGLIVVATRHTAAATDDLHVFGRVSALLMVTMAALSIAHLSEIAVWAGFYSFAGLTFKNANAFEFAFENYSALG